MSKATLHQDRRSTSGAAKWNRKQFAESLDLLRSLNLPTSVIEYCRLRARETGRLPDEFLPDIVEARRQRHALDAPEPRPLLASAEVPPEPPVQPERQGGRSQLTAEALLLSLGLVVVVVVAAMVFVGGLLHHAIASVNTWVANLTPPELPQR
ncbi:MAG TPA: hypothetical protein VJT33_03420 [bacterium]|nr:hypothetical protein [bacterium]